MALSHQGFAVAEQASRIAAQKKALPTDGALQNCSSRFGVRCQAGATCAVIAKLGAARKDMFLSSGALRRTLACPWRFSEGQCLRTGDGGRKRGCSPRIESRATEIAAPGFADGTTESMALEPLEDQAGGAKQDLDSVAGSYDIVILTNGPGEVAAWVKPVVKALRRRFGEDRARLRISVSSSRNSCIILIGLLTENHRLLGD